jgi:hypothetical protein
MLLCVLASCAKKEMPAPAVGFSSFTFKATNNQGLTTDVTGIIQDGNIVVKVPAAADITALVPTYGFSNPETIVYVNKQPQENGVSVVDFTQPVEFQLRGRESRGAFMVTVVKTAAFTKFGFRQQENAGLIFKDYTAVVKGLNVTVVLPVGTDVSKLVPYFETTTGATVKFNGTAEQSATTAHDFTNPVSFSLSDAEVLTPAVFTVTVTFLTSPVWQKVGQLSWPQEGIVSGSLKLAINPATNFPYITYQLSKDAAGVSYAAENKKIVVLGYSETGWEAIGAAAGLSEGDGRDPAIAFDKTGMPYVAYRDYSDPLSANQQKVTVRKYSGNAWSVVGGIRFTPSKTENLALGVDGNNMPWISVSKQDAAADASGFERRQLYTMKYDNTSWSVVGFPSKVLAGGGTKLLRVNDKLYLGAPDRTTGTQSVSAFELNGNQWSNIGPASFLADNKPLFTQMTLAVGLDGSKYAAYQNNSVANGKLEYILKYNGATWDKLGTPVNIGSGDERFGLAVGSTVYFVYYKPATAIGEADDAAGLYVRSFNKQTNNWNTPVNIPLSDASESLSGVDIAVSGDGIPYLAFGLTKSGKIEIHKLDLPK